MDLGVTVTNEVSTTPSVNTADEGVGITKDIAISPSSHIYYDPAQNTDDGLTGIYSIGGDIGFHLITVPFSTICSRSLGRKEDRAPRAFAVGMELRGRLPLAFGLTRLPAAVCLCDPLNLADEAG